MWEVCDSERGVGGWHGGSQAMSNVPGLTLRSSDMLRTGSMWEVCDSERGVGGWHGGWHNRKSQPHGARGPQDALRGLRPAHG
jgi:hypothetical protein